jgi:micrococcal nuclease
MLKSKHPCPCSYSKSSRKCGLPQCYFVSYCFWVSVIILFSLSYPPGGDAKTFHGRVIKVFDGDTFLVKVQGREEKVRLREIDAPEISTRRQKGQEPWGRKAKKYLLSKIRNRAVRLEVEEGMERDQYQRLLAYVFVGELFVNREMIRSGHAFFYGGPFLGKYSKELKKAEREAREKGFGVWNRKNGLRERPWEFRRRGR